MKLTVGAIAKRRVRLAILLFAALLGTASVPASETITYIYDGSGRLVKVARSGSVNNGVSSCYAYDKADNRSNVIVAASACSDPSVAPTFSIDNASVTEGGTLVFTITKYGATAGSFSVNYATASGTAAAGSDFTASSGTVTFLPSEYSKTVSIAVPADSIAELIEAMTVNLTSPTGGASITDAVGDGTIADKDAVNTPPSFSISDASVTEGGIINFTVTKTGTAAFSYNVYFSTAGGTAVSGSDFTAATGYVSFLPGDTTKTLGVLTANDSLLEPTENFTMNLTSASGGATIGNGAAIGTITDNETPPDFTIDDVSISEGSSLVFTVTKSGTASATVNYATADGTADGSDYAGASGTLSFTGSQTTRTVTVATTGDTAVESNETVLLNLSGPTGGGTILDSQGVGTIVDNDGGTGACSGVTFSVNDVSVTEGSPLVFTVTKSGSASTSCSLSYATANGTAVAPTHYTAKSGTLTFTSGQTSQTVSVATIDLGRLNATLRMYLNLSSPSAGGAISDSQGQGSIAASGGGGGCKTC